MPARIPESITIDTIAPSQLDRDDWRHVHELGARSLEADPDLNRSSQEVAAYMGAFDSQYPATRTNPNILVALGLMRKGQIYTRPSVVVARDGDKTVGYGYAADNVSGGSESIIAAKSLLPSKVWRWTRELFVDPDYQGRGIGTVVLGTLLDTAKMGQPASAYVYDVDENPRIVHLFTKAGIEQDVSDPEPTHAFGQDARVAQMQRFSTRRARAAARLLLNS